MVLAQQNVNATGYESIILCKAPQQSAGFHSVEITHNGRDFTNSGLMFHYGMYLHRILQRTSWHARAFCTESARHLLSVDNFISKVFPEHVDRTGGTTVMVSRSIPFLYLLAPCTRRSRWDDYEPETFLIVAFQVQGRGFQNGCYCNSGGNAVEAAFASSALLTCEVLAALDEKDSASPLSISAAHTRHHVHSQPYILQLTGECSSIVRRIQCFQ